MPFPKIDVTTASSHGISLYSKADKMKQIVLILSIIAAGGKGPDWNGVLRPGPVANGLDYSYVIPVANSFPPYVMVENDKVEGLRQHRRQHTDYLYKRQRWLPSKFQWSSTERPDLARR